MFPAYLHDVRCAAVCLVWRWSATALKATSRVSVTSRAFNDGSKRLLPIKVTLTYYCNSSSSTKLKTDTLSASKMHFSASDVRIVLHRVNAFFDEHICLEAAVGATKCAMWQRILTPWDLPRDSST